MTSCEHDDVKVLGELLQTLLGIGSYIDLSLGHVSIRELDVKSHIIRFILIPLVAVYQGLI